MNLNTLRLMGIAGMEDASELVDNVESIAEDLPTTPEEVETQTAEVAVANTAVEVQDLAQAVVDVAEAVEEQQEQVEELADSVEGLEGLIKSGAYSPVAAALLYSRCQTLNAKLGGRDTGSVLGAESLGDASTAQMAMTAGMESFVDTVKKYTNAAIEFIKGLWDTVIAFVVGLFNNCAGIRRMAESLKKRVDAAGFEAKKKIKLGKWNAFVDITGKHAAVADAVGEISEVAKELALTVSEAEGIASAVAGGNVNVSGFATKYKTLTQKLHGLVSKAGNKKQQKAATKDTVTATLGGVTILLTIDTGDITTLEDVSRAAKATRVQFKPNYDGQGVKTSGEVATKLDKSALKSYLDEVISLSKAIEVAKNNKAYTAAGRDNVIAKMKVLATKDDVNVPKACSAIKSIYSMGNLILTSAARYATDGMSAMNQCVKAHM